ncbi:subtilisin like protease [Clostridium fallax]|uniref:Subtilase family protein n=2 Tax=Clostridium fallax TaxID=1533 RepID=A0A1M4T779_9CLOT|nr:Subtilase family protein [Clostridium fallax]SQB22631.1 subtilisin like protease [Clostridium fallax]
MLNLLSNIPEQILNKLGKISENEKINKGKIELVVLCGENVDNVDKTVDNLGGKFENLGYGFGIVTFPAGEIEKINQVEGVIYAELPKVIFTTDYYSNRASCISIIQGIEGLTGKDTLVGFIDTGIDYTHKAFINNNGESRIEYIYDISEGGIIYTREQINAALKSNNPYDIVKSRDTTGHGTHVAGIACAGGNIDRLNYGIAYESDIIMVKVTREGNANFSLSTQLMRGLKFLIDKSKELKKPLVVNISMSTNDGAHNGSSLLEQYIEIISKLERVTIVIASGNEGDAAHHVGGELRNNISISLEVSTGERSINLQLYKPLLIDITMSVTNPVGRSSAYIPITEGYNEFFVGEDKVFIYSSGPKPFDINGEITIALVPKSQFLTSGEWVVNIIKTNEYEGFFDMWLPISEGLNIKTRFLQPDVYNTLGIPATVRGALSVGSYNYKTNTLSSFSGRGGRNSYNYIKPDILAPGEEILSTVIDGGFDTLSGTSMAAPHGAGVCALLMEWGIAKGNDPFLFGDRLKYYLLKGAKRFRRDIKYPDYSWGYGTLCGDGAFELISNLNRGKDMNMRVDNDFYLSSDYTSLLVEYVGDLINNVQKSYPSSKVFILDENYALIYVKRSESLSLIEDIKEIVYIDIGGVYTLTAISPVEATEATLFHDNIYLPLNGNGVVVGIVDTGIDYLNTEFINEDDTSRVIRIWDQTMISENPSNRLPIGIEYNREQINNAIKESMAGRDPYLIVPSKDDLGHGTNMASIAGARGKNKEIIGAAPNCEFAIVKLKEASRSYLEYFGFYGSPTGKYENTDILLGIRYLASLAKELKKPMVIYIPVGTNIGAHDGSSIIERYIDDISKSRGVVVVADTGNQGDTDTHVAGELKQPGDVGIIELRVGKLERRLMFEIWIRKPDKYSLSIISPSGEIIEEIPPKLKQETKLKFLYEGTTAEVRYLIPEEVTGDQKITIILDDVKEGIWQFKLIGNVVVQGRYDAWLPQDKLLAPDTKFLNPTQYGTITIPATARRVISTSFYNQNNNATVGTSGRGYTRDGRIKPDLTSGGINAKAVSPGGSVVEVSGASVAGAVLSGCCALILQWGIIDGNDPSIYSTKLITYLIRGTSKRAGDVYPNPQWGYGMLNVKGVFDATRSEDENIDELEEFENYYVGSMLIRRPKIY